MMNIKHTIKDNYLNEADYEKIRDTMKGDYFPWYFHDVVVTEDDTDDSHFFWTHIFFDREKGVASTFYKILHPLLNKLKFKALIRIKANLYSNQGKIIEHKDHADFPFKHKGALFSINSNNGFTILKDNTKIKSVANRMLLFDPSIPHRSSTCTDAKMRCNININYF